MKKLMMLLAVLAVLMVPAVPALSQVGQGFDQNIDKSGDVNLNSEIVNTGDNSNQCAAPMQFGNTGSVQNAQGFVQYASEADDVKMEGASMSFDPEQNVECNQSVSQNSFAS